MRWVQIEGVAYWSLFVAVFLCVAIWESVAAKHALNIPAGRRWGKHGLLFVGSMLAVALLLRMNPVFAAMYASHNRYGLLNTAALPFAFRCILAVLILDFVKYAVHRAHHAFPLLWRVHQIHHSDPDFDVSTAGRAHPIEVLLTQGATLAAVFILAPPVVAVLIAELLACFQSFFEHANASLPAGVERGLRWWIVTPDLHRVHHSREVWDQSRNLGEIFTWWDRLLGTYSSIPQAGLEQWTPGLEEVGSADAMRLRFLLTQPLHPPRT